MNFHFILCRSNVVSPVARPSTTPTTSGSSRKRKRQDTNDMEEALTALIKQTTQSRDDLDKQLQECHPKTAEDVFFESCALRIKKLPPSVRSFLQLQISQLFINAENPQLQIPITPLPATQQQPQQQQHDDSQVQLGCNTPAPTQNAHCESQVYVQYGSSPVSEQGIMYTPTPQIISTAMAIANDLENAH